MTAAVFQTIAAAASAITALIGMLLALRNFPRLMNWLKTRDTLIVEKNAAEANYAEVVRHNQEARQSVTDVRNSLEAVRMTNAALADRLEQLEQMKPLYDAAMAWTPLAFEYVAWLEHVALNAKVELAGRQMPPLPNVLVEYFSARKNMEQSG